MDAEGPKTAAAVRVIVIDDSAASMAAITLVVNRGQGCVVIGYARNADMAHTLVSRLRPDVVTLDLGMSEGGGFALLADLVESQTPVVIVSASTREGSPVSGEALRLGADACFDKAKILSESLRFIGVLRAASGIESGRDRFRSLRN